MDEIQEHLIIGNGKKTLVFIHYFGGDAGSWKWLAKRLGKKFTCVLLNLPGFGGTQPLKEPSIFGFAAYINKKIESLSIGNYILCGHSMGAKLALYAAKLNVANPPERIVLIAPSPPTVEDMSQEERSRMLEHPDAEEAIATVAKVTNRKMTDKRKSYAVQSQLRIDNKTWQWWLKEGMDDDISERITGLQIPTCVIFSNRDPVISPDTVFKEVMPYLEMPSVVALSKSGHLVPMEAPRKLSRRIKKFIRAKPLVANTQG